MPAISSGIVTGDVLVSYWLSFPLFLVTIPEVFERVNPFQFSFVNYISFLKRRIKWVRRY